MTHWPTVFVGNEVIWGDPLQRWHTNVEKVILSGEKHCTLSLHPAVSKVHFYTTSQSVKLNDNPLQTTNSSQPNFDLRAHLLVNECSRLRPTGEAHTIRQYTQAAGTSQGDSDDDVPPDQEIPAAFSHVELEFINRGYRDLWLAFHRANFGQFQNAVGKFFFIEFSKFILLVHPGSTSYQYAAQTQTVWLSQVPCGLFIRIH